MNREGSRSPRKKNPGEDTAVFSKDDRKARIRGILEEAEEKPRVSPPKRREPPPTAAPAAAEREAAAEEKQEADVQRTAAPSSPPTQSASKQGTAAVRRARRRRQRASLFFGLGAGSSRKALVPVWVRPVVGACCIFILFVCLVVSVARSFRGGDAATRLTKAGLTHQLATEVLGRHLSATFDKPAVVFVTEPITKSNRHVYEAWMRGLETGFGGRIDLLRPVTPEGYDSADPMAGDTWPSARAFEDAVEQRQPCDLVVSCVGLPELVGWQKGDPRVVIIHSVPGTLGQLRDMRQLAKRIHAGQVAAVVAVNPRGVITEPFEAVPEDWDAARRLFDQQFVLVDESNVDDVVRQVRR